MIERITQIPGTMSGWISHLHALSNVCNGFLRFTSSATPADFLTAGMAAELFLPMHLQIPGCFGFLDMSTPGFLSYCRSLACVFSQLCDPQIHLWCDTY